MVFLMLFVKATISEEQKYLFAITWTPSYCELNRCEKGENKP